MFIRLRTQYIDSVQEFNELLDYANKYKFIALNDYDYEPLENMAFIEDKLVEISIIMNKDGKNTRFTFYKDGRHGDKVINGVDAFIPMANSFHHATGYKIPVYENPEEYGTANALLAYREDMVGQRFEAWAYDAKSAYGWGMCQPMPDTREFAGVMRKVEEGEMGFTVDTREIPGFKICEEYRLRMVDPGEYATYIFKTMESPFKKFADKWYKIKETKTGEEKAKAKQMLCYSVGFLQRKNPFLRAAVVEHCNRYMESLMDENTVYINTDSIVSLKPRDDIKIGTNLGEFKLEHHGQFAYTGFNCQWDDDAPVYRGVPKSWFDNNYDILTGTIPYNRNIFELNHITMKLEETKNGKEKSTLCI